MSLTLLVTGGAGFIGSNFIRHMIKNYPGYRIVNYDKLTYAGNLENLRDVENSSGYEFINGDITDGAKLRSVNGAIDAIINFAAESHVDRSIEMAAEFMSTNIIGTQVLLEFCREKNIPRFIQISTDEVYGSVDNGSFTENDRLTPSSPYSASKAAADLLAISYFTTYDMPVIITRSSNNFGPYQYPEKMIPLFTTNALEGRTLPIYGDGKNVRDWIYVEDNCSAINAVLQDGAVGQVYNIGAGNEFTNIEVAEGILGLTGRSNDLMGSVTDRLGHDRRYSINCDKVKKLGWEQAYEFDDALEKTVEWYRNNRSWWEPLVSE